MASTANLIIREALTKVRTFGGSYYGLCHKMHRISSKQDAYKLYYSRYTSRLPLNILVVVVVVVAAAVVVNNSEGFLEGH